jgi:hypothetical protein
LSSAQSNTATASSAVSDWPLAIHTRPAFLLFAFMIFAFKHVSVSAFGPTHPRNPRHPFCFSECQRFSFLPPASINQLANKPSNL